MSNNNKERFRFWAVVISVCVGVFALIYRWVISDVALKGILQIVWRKWTQKILPNQPVHWLVDYQSKSDAWSYLETTNYFEERPNILLIVADDLGSNDLAGGCGISTPNIGSIGRNGINFTNAYASHATCAPSRAALFTGRYPTSIGMEFTPIPKFFARFMADKRPAHAAQTIYHQELYDLVPDMVKIHLPKTSPIISEVLQQVGYHNYFLGKWDGSFNPDEFSPLHRGYDETLAIPLGASLYASANDPRIVSSNNISVDQFMKKFLSYYIQFNNGPIFEPADYLTDYLGREAVSLIHRLAEKRSNQSSQEDKIPDEPWFTTITFTAPHNPFQALKSDYDSPDIQQIPTFIGRVYASMIKALDRNVGRILDALKATNQYDNTLIIFTSDNGGAPYVGLSHLNAPYRGWKATLFEGGLRVPFLLQWPKKIPAGQVITTPLIHLDIFPSLFTVAMKGLRRKIGRGMMDFNNLVLNGKDFISGLLNGTDSDSESVASTDHSLGDSPPVIVSDQTLETQYPEKDSRESAIIPFLHPDHSRIFYWRSGTYKTLRYYHYKLQVHSYLNKLWLFDLLQDPTEKQNLIPLIGEAIGVSTLTESTLQELLIQKISDQREISSSSQKLLSVLIFLYQRLQEVDQQQSKPLWPALVELPICIDKPQLEGDLCTLDEEHIIWAN